MRRIREPSQAEWRLDRSIIEGHFEGIAAEHDRHA